MDAIRNRYEFVVLFDVENGNPNGDIDMGNAPRTDVETGHGLVTDVCLKRKIRNYVELVKGDEPGYGILIKTDRSLNDKLADAHRNLDSGGKNGGKLEDIVRARRYMCENYYDVRTFGATMNTGDSPCGKVRGPVQIGIAKSIDRIWPQEITITRQAITDTKKFEELMGKDGMATEIGKKYIVPYALYRAEGYVSANLARDTNFSDDDLALFWESVMNMFEHDRSSTRGKMAVRRLFVFRHDSVLGNAPSAVLFDKIKVERRREVEYPRGFGDYVVTADPEMPSGVEMTTVA